MTAAEHVALAESALDRGVNADTYKMEQFHAIVAIAHAVTALAIAIAGENDK